MSYKLYMWAVSSNKDQFCQLYPLTSAQLFYHLCSKYPTTWPIDVPPTHNCLRVSQALGYTQISWWLKVSITIIYDICIHIPGIIVKPLTPLYKLYIEMLLAVYRCRCSSEQWQWRCAHILLDSLSTVIILYKFSVNTWFEQNAICPWCVLKCVIRFDGSSLIIIRANSKQTISIFVALAN